MYKTDHRNVDCIAGAQAHGCPRDGGDHEGKTARTMGGRVLKERECLSEKLGKQDQPTATTFQDLDSSL